MMDTSITDGSLVLNTEYIKGYKLERENKE